MQERYVIVRSLAAGCFAGVLKSHEADRVILRDSRRLWFWSGAASLSQLAMEGVKNPKACKFPIKCQTQEILGVIEIIDATPVGRASIEAVPVWSA